MTATPTPLCIADDATFWPWRRWPEFSRWEDPAKTTVIVPLAGMADWGLGHPLDAEETILMFPKALSPKVWDTMYHHLLPDGTSRPQQVITESHNTGPVSVMRGVAAGKGVAPALAPVAEHARPEGVVLRPLDPPLTLPLELAWREPANGALQRVVAFLQSECRPSVIHHA